MMHQPQPAPNHTIYPTSPWTDVYYPEQMQSSQTDWGMPSALCVDGEDQQPTHDALSEAYTN